MNLLEPTCPCCAHESSHELGCPRSSTFGATPVKAEARMLLDFPDLEKYLESVLRPRPRLRLVSNRRA